MATSTQPNPARSTRISENVVLLSLQFSAFGNTRSVDSRLMIEGEEGDADPRLVKITKTLIDAPERRNIQRLDGEVRSYIVSRSLPSLFRSGVYMVPLALVAEVEASLAKFAALRVEAVEALRLALPAVIERAAVSLGTLFLAADYPSPDTIAGQFGFRWEYITLETPRSLQSISKELFEAEKKKAEVQWKSAQDELRMLLRQQMLELVDHMASAVADDGSGKRKVFRASLTEKIGDFMQVFQARNITDDAELAALVGEARAILDGVDSKELKSNDRARGRVAKTMEGIKAKLSTMIEVKPGRAIALGGDV